jgi:hypothetical protein
MHKTEKPSIIMSNAEVSALMKKSPATTRSNIHRSTMGRSTPDFPAPAGKFAGAWAWLREDVEEFIAKKGGS